MQPAELIAGNTGDPQRAAGNQQTVDCNFSLIAAADFEIARNNNGRPVLVRRPQLDLRAGSRRHGRSFDIPSAVGDLGYAAGLNGV